MTRPPDPSTPAAPTRGADRTDGPDNPDPPADVFLRTVLRSGLVDRPRLTAVLGGLPASARSSARQVIDHLIASGAQPRSEAWTCRQPVPRSSSATFSGRTLPAATTSMSHAACPTSARSRGIPSALLFGGQTSDDGQRSLIGQISHFGFRASQIRRP